MFNIIYYDNYIKLVLRKSYFYKYIDSIFDCFYNHKLFDFKYSDNTGIYNYKNSFDDYLFYDIDRDYNSIYSPISIDTKVINLFECFYDSSNSDNTFNLLDSYSREFISNNISLLLMYGFLDK